jgi:hypothetical protein
VGLRLIDSEHPDQTTIVQASRMVQGTDTNDVQLTWLLRGPLKAGATASFLLEVEKPATGASPWNLNKVKGGQELRHGDKLVFQYNTEPQSNAKYGPIQHRDGYIHPAYSPSGALVTGDFSPFHPHHRGFFLAYAKAQIEKEPLDFWNIHTNKGTIRHQGLDRVEAGPVSALISTRHIWNDKSGKPIARERWDVEIFEVPGSPFWVFDLTSTQQAVDKPIEVLPYRYGGMAYRGAEPFVKGKLDVLNAEGKHRVDGNLQATRWVDLTGPVADGSTAYAGAMIADHPANLNHPTVARIHPTTLPFFSFVPASSKTVVIDSKTPLVFRYRVLIHDGHPDGTLDERIWGDFASPPKVMISGS